MSSGGPSALMMYMSFVMENVETSIVGAANAIISTDSIINKKTRRSMTDLDLTISRRATDSILCIDIIMTPDSIVFVRG